ncbi:hypothetical protein BC834DRAFT_975235 [Gloeopeniophorella convolvens]|nr:hypothetical protein BC834DRAFT_975235 [Gloeopeniophorella convolvens]
MQLLTTQGPGKRSAKSKDEAKMRCLEHLALRKRRAVCTHAFPTLLPRLTLSTQRPALHTELALAYIDKAPLPYRPTPAFTNTAPAAASYTSAPPPTPLSYYLEVRTPAKHTRLHTVLSLQRSSTYDAPAMCPHLMLHTPLLAPELALVAGKAGDTRIVHGQASAAALCAAPALALLAERVELAIRAPLPAAD